MRVCIAYKQSKNGKLEKIAKGLAQGIEKANSAVVEIIDIDKESDKKLTGYKYILFGCSKISLLNNNLPTSYSNYIKNCGHITGKHTFAFTDKAGFAQKFLSNFMAELEREGVLLKTSSIIGSPEEAKIIGSKLHIK